MDFFATVNTTGQIKAAFATAYYCSSMIAATLLM